MIYEVILHHVQVVHAFVEAEDEYSAHTKVLDEDLETLVADYGVRDEYDRIDECIPLEQ